MILTPLQKMPNNVGELGKIIVDTSFEWLPKVQKIAKSGHTGIFTLVHIKAKWKKLGFYLKCLCFGTALKMLSTSQPKLSIFGLQKIKI